MSKPTVIMLGLCWLFGKCGFMVRVVGRTTIVANVCFIIIGRTLKVSPISAHDIKFN